MPPRSLPGPPFPALLRSEREAELAEQLAASEQAVGEAEAVAQEAMAMAEAAEVRHGWEASARSCSSVEDAVPPAQLARSAVCLVVPLLGSSYLRSAPPRAPPGRDRTAARGQGGAGGGGGGAGAAGAALCRAMAARGGWLRVERAAAAGHVVHFDPATVLIDLSQPDATLPPLPHPALPCPLQTEAAQSSHKWKEGREAKREAEWDARLKEAYK